jgi:phage-related protein
MGSRNTREIAWIKAARKDFEKFPLPAQRTMARALTVAAEGGKADIAKPMKGLGSGVFEIALPYRSDAYRVVYAVQLEEAVWVVHAFQKKSTTGIKTAQKDIDLIRERIKRLKETLR